MVATTVLFLSEFFLCDHDNSWTAALSSMKFCTNIYLDNRSKPRKFQGGHRSKVKVTEPDFRMLYHCMIIQKSLYTITLNRCTQLEEILHEHVPRPLECYWITKSYTTVKVTWVFVFFCVCCGYPQMLGRVAWQHLEAYLLSRSKVKVTCFWYFLCAWYFGYHGQYLALSRARWSCYY